MLFLMFRAINRHYSQVSTQLQTEPTSSAREIVQDFPINGSRSHKIIVPIATINKVSLMALDFARSLGEDVTALYISDDREAIEALSEKWQAYKLDLPLVILENPFRTVVPPLLHYLEGLDKLSSDDVLMVILPEFVAQHWWELILHNQTALRIKNALLSRPGVVVIDVPYHMRRSGDDRDI